MGGAISQFDYEAQLQAETKPRASWANEEDIVTDQNNDNSKENGEKGETSAIYRALGMFEKREDGKSVPKKLVETFELPEVELKEYASELEKFNVPTVLRTVNDMLNYGRAKHGAQNIYGTRYRNDDGTIGEYKWMTFEQLHKNAHDFGRGLATQCNVKRHGNVGVFSINRVEWCISSWANATRGYRTVAVYDTFGDEAVEHVLRHAELTVVAAEKRKVAKLIEMKKKCGDDLPLKYIIQFDEMEGINNKEDAVEDEDKKACSELGLELIGFSEVLKKGAESDIEADPPSSDDISFIMYTSGTTGVPKGAMLSHGNLIATAAGEGSNGFELQSTDRHLSYLTLAHIYESILHLVYMRRGGRIAFYRGDFKKLADDWTDVDPTVFCGVPRVYQRIYDKVMGGVAEAPLIRRLLFRYFYKRSVEAVRRGERDETADKKVWIPLREKLGLKNVRGCITGAAPMAGYLAEFLRVVLGAVILQGYGMTESAAGCTIQNPDDLTVSHVGIPSSCVEVKLVAVPEMGYSPVITEEKPYIEGEVRMRGSNVFKGYYKMEDKTKEAFPEGDGWLATGDIGRFNPNGTLSIIDRKKNIFKLSQGEYVAPERVENLYSQSNAVAQSFVYGNSFKPFLVAVVVPSFDFVAKLAKEKGWWPKDEEVEVDHEGAAEKFAKLFADGEESATILRDAVVADMRTKEEALKGFEKVRDVIIESSIDAMGQGFSVDNNCVTPSFKLKRVQCKERYKAKLIEIYEKNGESGSEGF